VSSRAKFADRQAILAAIREREALMSTGIKQGIAIPHGKTTGVDGVCGVLGISRRGIEYDALDGQPVHLVFLLLSGPDAAESHLRALKKLALLLESESFKKELEAAASPQEAYRVLERYEDVGGLGE
jgi:PTS system fructose-specific IIC component/PTS system nitrogen regulatory IIA component